MSGLWAALAGRRGRFPLEISFAAPAGVVTALVGPSGSGKTSVLRALAGLDRLSGEVRVGDERWQGPACFVPAHRRRAALIFQGANLLPHLSVAANIAYAAARAPHAAAIGPIAARLGIAGLLDRKPHSLSGGEAQRVALARALVMRPRLLLMDEPLSALDGTARADLLAYLADVLPGLAIPVVLVSHHPDEVARLAARVIAMEHGRLPAPGSTPPAVR